jgi:predicted urease superfamily metal-dependent hydrolase
MPIVYEDLDFGARMHELERLCRTAGRPTAPVTAGIWEIDEPLMERCAELGVDRCLVVFHAEDKDSFPEFLERYSRLVQRFDGPRTLRWTRTPDR